MYPTLEERGGIGPAQLVVRPGDGQDSSTSVISAGEPKRIGGPQ